MMRARDNPFCAERIEGLAYRPINGSLEQLMTDLGRMDYCGAIVGPEGSGKTTLLTDLGRRLTEKGFAVRSVFVSEGSPFTKARRREFFNELRPEEIILFDGADHLSPIVWRRF
ncbi:MAG: DEAD/DEAH box helicase family protein, partial [Planctomycetota bacterium]